MFSWHRNCKVQCAVGCHAPNETEIQMKNKITQRIIKILSDNTDLSEVDILLDSKLESLGLDSLENISLRMDIEREFEITISDEQWEDVLRVEDIVECVASCKDLYTGIKAK